MENTSISSVDGGMVAPMIFIPVLYSYMFLHTADTSTYHLLGIWWENERNKVL